MNKNEKFVITINREVGSGGRTVGRKLAETLGVKYCDKAVIDGLTKKFGLTPERIEEIKAQKKQYQPADGSRGEARQCHHVRDGEAHPAGAGLKDIVRHSRPHRLHGVP